MQNYKKNLIISSIILAILFLIFSMRLFYLQISNGEEFEHFSRKNYLRFINTPSLRGKIFDRNGKEVVINKPKFDVIIYPREVENIEEMSVKLSNILDIPSEEIRANIQNIVDLNHYRPPKLTNNISRDQLALIEVKKNTLKGVEIEVNYQREYPHGNVGSLILGYTGLVTEKELSVNPKLKRDQYTGKSGVEKKFEPILMGIDGQKYIVVDAFGRIVPIEILKQHIEENKKSVEGNNLHLTIDIELQKQMENLLLDKQGAIIVMDVNNGEILALASKPSFDIRKFSQGITQQEWDLITKEEQFSMFNRATQGTYPPGSVFKIMTAFALLKEKVVDLNSQVYCEGHYRLGDERKNCWNKTGHGWVNLHKALVKSCDVYFYHMSNKMGIDKLSKYIKIFGFGEKTGIELSEKEGIAPSKSWKLEKFNTPWYKGDTISIAIGQGYVSVTPLQIAVMTASIANGGYLLKPTIMRKIVDINDNIIEVNSKNIKSELPENKQIVPVLQKALYGVVNGKEGTGRFARSKISISGKTGTAQVVSLETKTKKEEFLDHAWFTSYAPSKNPEVSITVLVENGGNGGTTAAPLAKKAMEIYFDLKKQNNDI